MYCVSHVLQLFLGLRDHFGNNETSRNFYEIVASYNFSQSFGICTICLITSHTSHHAILYISRSSLFWPFLSRWIPLRTPHCSGTWQWDSVGLAGTSTGIPTKNPGVSPIVICRGQESPGWRGLTTVCEQVSFTFVAINLPV